MKKLIVTLIAALMVVSGFAADNGGNPYNQRSGNTVFLLEKMES